jgi:microcystin degradation protein MlrC
MPALVRGPELVTATGLYGRVIDRAKAMETGGEAMSAAVLIGNPFTDAPELGSQALVVTDNDPEQARRLAMELAQAFWADHEKMVAELVGLPEAMADAVSQGGPVTFTDAADAPSSGASGDSNTILAALLAAGYRGRAIMPMVDAPAAARAHAAGVGARLRVSLGGTIDPARFPPLELEVEVERLGDGEYLHAFSGMPAHAGPTAVLRHGDIRIVVVTHAVFMMDREIFVAHGLDPEQADIIVVKSPGAALRFFTFARRNHVLDIPGATSANLRSLGHTVCPRPMFPLDEGVVFNPKVELFAGGVRGRRYGPPIVPALRSASISASEYPAPRKICRLCSPCSGWRMAGTLSSPVMVKGLSMVRKSLSAIGLMMPAARACSSAAASSTVPTMPKVRPAASRVLRQ